MKVHAVFCLAVGILLARAPAGAAPAADTAQPWTLEACIRTALETHGDALAAAQNVDAASAQRRGAGSTLFYPTVSAESSRTEGRTETQQLSRSAYNQENMVRLGVTFWDGGVQRENVRRARAGESGATASLQRTRQMLAYQVTDAYLAVLRAKQTLKVAEQKVTQAQEQKAMIEGKIKAGAAAEVDIYPVEVQIASARVDQIRSANDVRTAGSALRNAMGLGPGTVPDVAEMPEKMPAAPTLEECMRLAQERRPELRQAQASIDQQRAGLNLARLNLLPRLSVGAGLDRGLGDSTIVNQWNVKAILSWSLYDRVDRANVDAARANMRVSEEQEQQVVKDIAAEVEQAHLSLTSANERIAAAEASVAMARKNLEVAQARYKLDLAIPLEIVDAQVAFSNAQLQAIGARYDYLLSRAQLDRAIGADAAAD